MPVQCTCERCGVTFYRRPSFAQRARFCSVACTNGPQAVCTCQVCGRPYTVKPSHAPLSRYCSRPCRHLGDRARTAPLVDRFWARVEKTDTCWLWTGSIGAYGYGEITPGHAGTMKAHRLAWTLATGDELSSDVDICHTCDVRHCVRNDDIGTYEVAGVVYERRGHLFLGDHAANAKDMAAKGRNGTAVHPETIRRGTSNHLSKLSEADVLEIRARHARGERYRAIGEAFGVHRETISHIVRRLTWAHLE